MQTAFGISCTCMNELARASRYPPHGLHLPKAAPRPHPVPRPHGPNLCVIHIPPHPPPVRVGSTASPATCCCSPLSILERTSRNCSRDTSVLPLTCQSGPRGTARHGGHGHHRRRKRTAQVSLPSPPTHTPHPTPPPDKIPPPPHIHTVVYPSAGVPHLTSAASGWLLASAELPLEAPPVSDLPTRLPKRLSPFRLRGDKERHRQARGARCQAARVTAR